MKSKISVKIAIGIILCMLLQLIFTIPVLSAGVSPDGYTLVSTQAELAAMTNNLAGKYRLTNDITLMGNWTPIGSANAVGSQFLGTLDGAGYTIFGLNISKSTSGAGLFGYSSGAIIKNLTLSGNITYTGPSTSAYVGSFIGYAKGSLLIENCTSSVNITGTGTMGGFVGYAVLNNSLIIDCTYTGKITGTSGYIGGIIGRMTADGGGSAVISKIYQCRVVVEPNANPNDPSEYLAERITGASSNVGGIAGQFTGIIEQCYTTVKVHGNGSVGGIIGDAGVNNYTTSNFGSTIQDCFSTGDILNDSGNTGGIGGRLFDSKGRHTVNRCYSTSNVYSTSSLSGDNTGGIIGYINSSTAKNDFAINREIRQTHANAAVGRITSDNTVVATYNYAKADIPVYWKGVLQNISGTLTDRNGQNIADFELQTETPYRNVGWDFDNVWVMNSAVSPYPVLKWAHTPAPPPPVVFLEADKITIEVAETAEIEASGMITGDSVLWLGTSNPSIATISTNGNFATVTGVSPGQVTISATTALGAPIAEITITVVEPEPIDPVTLAIALDVGEKCSLAGLTANNTQADMTGYTWQSNDNNIVTVNPQGKVTAVDYGTAQIIASNGAVTLIISVIVRPEYAVIEPEPPSVGVTSVGDGTVTLTWQTPEANDSLIYTYTLTVVDYFGPGFDAVQSMDLYAIENRYIVNGETHYLIITDLENYREYTFYIDVVTDLGNFRSNEIRVTPQP